ncbi:MAG TPA: IS30 family transposase [Candidatus Dormibacteraeota bacterium]|nr:IS30 family transposase [Candidatus Dormibacteraeota bacterium]
MNYIQLTIEERERIQELIWQKVSVRAIAKELGRNASSISREIKRNQTELRQYYRPRLAHSKALERRTHRGKRRLDTDKQLLNYVKTYLKLGWSPEQISARSKDLTDASISYEAIYQYIYAQIHRNGQGYVKPGREDLRPYLARRRNRRMKKGLRKSYRIQKGPLPSIDSRPKEATTRTVVGHWEDDSIVYTPTCGIRLRTTNELTSGVVFIARTKDSTMLEANRITNKRLGRLPPELLKTLTRDRGSENMGFAELEQSLGINCFFAHAYHSWERGANENLNGLIRRYLPKGTDFRTLSDQDIAQIEYLINSRPRKRLGWKTPYEVFYELTGVALLD